MTHSGTGWAAYWSATLSENLKSLRREQGIKSARELSDACETIGFPMPRNAIANIESGRKVAVPLHEILVLARALGVPPIRLLFDVTGDAVEVLPGVQTHPWTAALWFTGEAPLRSEYTYRPGTKDLSDADRESFEAGVAPIKMMRRHDDLVTEIIYSRGVIDSVLRDAARAGAGKSRDADLGMAWVRWQRVYHGQDDLRDHRGRMASAGITPPPLPDDVLGREPDDHEWSRRDELERERFDAYCRAVIEEADDA